MISRVALVLVAALLVSGCQLFEAKPDYKPYDVLGVVPQDFLFTTDDSFNAWLDTPVYVQMTAVPLLEVFEHPALQPLNYRWVTLPAFNTPITIYRVAITRRQLLWAIAHDHKLTMLPVLEADGVSYVEIRAQETVTTITTRRRSVTVLPK